MFTFRFETLLTTRRHAEEALQKDLSDAKRALTAEQALLRESKDAHRRSLLDMARRREQAFHPPDLQLFGPYHERLARDIDLRLKRVAAAERQVQQKRRLLIEAVKRRKVLEKLREKDEREFRQNLSREERKFMDDVAGRNARRVGSTRHEPRSA